MTDAGRRTGTSQVYTWEPSNQAIAARYGVAPESVVRFDTNTSPTEPGWLSEVLARPVRPDAQRVPRLGVRQPGVGRGRLCRRRSV